MRREGAFGKQESEHISRDDRLPELTIPTTKIALQHYHVRVPPDQSKVSVLLRFICLLIHDPILVYKYFLFLKIVLMIQITERILLLFKINDFF